MAKRRNDLLPIEFYEQRKPAKPFEFAFGEKVPDIAVQMCRSNEDRELLYAQLKRRAAVALSEFIYENCKFMDSSCPTGREIQLTIQMTINDRGSYEHWLPQERNEGRREGWAKARNELPYGIIDSLQD